MKLNNICCAPTTEGDTVFLMLEALASFIINSHNVVLKNSKITYCATKICPTSVCWELIGVIMAMSQTVQQNMRGFFSGLLDLHN